MGGETKLTMTLNLRAEEMAVVEQLAAEADLSKTALIRQALRFYQVLMTRLKAGETVHFSGDGERAALFIGLGVPLPAGRQALKAETDNG